MEKLLVLVLVIDADRKKLLVLVLVIEVDGKNF